MKVRNFDSELPGSLGGTGSLVSGSSLVNLYRDTVTSLTNRSGSARFAGDVVIVDTSADSSFTISASCNTLLPVGVLLENTAVGSNGRVRFGGLAESVSVGSNVTATRGSFLYHSSTPTRANPMFGTAPSAGAFGYVVAQGSNTAPKALIFPTYDGAGGAGSVSYGSNATRVREISAAGSATEVARFDHAHDGIGTITASSSNTMQRGTWNLRPGAGIALNLSDTDGDGEFDTTTIVNTGSGGGGGGGSSVASPGFVRTYAQASTASTSHSHTITAAASGNRLVVVVSSYGRDVNTPTCTNVTFTEVLAVNFGGAYLSVYVGVVSGGSSGTSVTVTAASSDWIITDIYEVTDALTPTAGSSATLTDTDASAVRYKAIGPLTITPGTFFVLAAAQNNGTTGFSRISCSDNILSAPIIGVNQGLTSAIGVASRTTVVGFYDGGTSGADLAAGIIAIT